MTVLYVFPHPDDESFGPGPAMARQRREGHAVHLLTLTKGGATKQRHRLGLSVEAMGAVREREMRGVAEVLDLSSMVVLDLPDGGLKARDPREIERVIEARIEVVRPDVLVTYAVHGISGHPDHLVCHAVAKRLFCCLQDERPDIAPRRLALFTLVDWPDDGERPVALNRSEPEDVGVLETFTEDDLAKGHAALACYETYRETIEQHRPLSQMQRGVPFELFGEDVAEPLASLFERMPER